MACRGVATQARSVAPACRWWREALYYLVLYLLCGVKGSRGVISELPAVVRGPCAKVPGTHTDDTDALESATLPASSS